VKISLACIYIEYIYIYIYIYIYTYIHVDTYICRTHITVGPEGSSGGGRRGWCEEWVMSG
jgi:hypothetical protein